MLWHCSAACIHAAHLRGCSRSPSLFLLLYQHLLTLQVLQQLLLLAPQEVQLVLVSQGSLLPLELGQRLRVVVACIQSSMAQDPAFEGSPCRPHSDSRTCTAY